jgi:hypothetical protein
MIGVNSVLAVFSNQTVLPNGGPDPLPPSVAPLVG